MTLATAVPYSVVLEPLREFALKFEYVNIDIRYPHQGNVSDLVSNGTAIFGVGFTQKNYPDDLTFTQLGRLVLAHMSSAGIAGSLTRLRSVTCIFIASWSSRCSSAWLGYVEYLDATYCWSARGAIWH